VDDAVSERSFAENQNHASDSMDLSPLLRLTDLSIPEALGLACIPVKLRNCQVMKKLKESLRAAS
jgi:hypothetical protein